MNLNEYKQKIQLYESFSCTVKDILIAAISSSIKSDEYHYHLQQIQCRAKTYESLYKRLEESKALESNNIEELRNDLSGCRIIFYYNNDVNAFVNSGIIHNNFRIDRDKSKLHGPGISPKSANEYYTANHYVIELSEDRLKLPEYSHFRGLKCEVQIQTVMNHAWSETAHDITYKKVDDSDFGKRVLDAIDDRLVKIMEQYLKPAGYEFQKIQQDHRKLLEGKKLLRCNLPQEIKDCKNNNERYEMLERYREYTLPHFSDYKNELSAILELINTAVVESTKIEPIEINTPMGPMSGKTLNDIFNISLSIINYIRYVDVTRTFTFLIELYLESPDESNKKVIRESIISLTKYDIDLLNKAGFAVQLNILDTLEGFDDDLLAKIKTPITDIGRHILDPTIEGISSNYNSVTIRKGSIPAGEKTSKLREKMLKMLFSQYNPRDPESTKRQFLSALKASTQIPTMSNYNDEQLEIILGNCAENIEFFMGLISTEQYEVLESIESDICFLYHCSSDILNGNRVTNKKCKALCKSIMEAAIVFREALNKVDDYVIYKTLVGFESVFKQSWEDDSLGFTEKNKYREEEAESYINKINDENQDYWRKLILRCTQTESSDMATFLVFCKFLNLLAVAHPVFSLKLVEENQETLMPFSTAIFDGLLRSDLHDDLIIQMNTWINNGEYLRECARVFESYNHLDEKLLANILSRACADSDKYALSQLIAVSAKNYNEDNKHLIDLLFLPAVQALTKLNNVSWISESWFRPEIKTLLSNLSIDEAKIILSNLVLLEKIDFHAEELLIPIAKKYPEEILNFFKERIDNEKDLSMCSKSYEAIPFNFHQLATPLACEIDIVLAAVSIWYNGNYHLFRFCGAKLISNVFPEYTPELNGKLLELISNGGEKNYYIVMAILLNYNGVSEINDICRVLISSLPEESELLKEISIIMQSTGVLRGEFGQVNALQQKKNAISSWLNDSNSKVRIFARKYIADLDKQVKYQKKLAEEDVELRKLQYNAEDS